MKRILCMLAMAVSIVAVSTVAVDTAAAQKTKKTDFVRNSELQTSGGLPIKIRRYGTFTLMSARLAEQPTRDCLIHIPSVQEQLLRIAADDGVSTASVWFEIKATTCDGEICCKGAGTGCEVEIKAPGE